MKVFIVYSLILALTVVKIVELLPPGPIAEFKTEEECETSYCIRAGKLANLDDLFLCKEHPKGGFDCVPQLNLNFNKPDDERDDDHEKPHDELDENHKKPHDKIDDDHEKPRDKLDEDHEKPHDKIDNDHEKPHNKLDEDYEELRDKIYVDYKKPHDKIDDAHERHSNECIA